MSRNPLSPLSLTAKICATATALVITSLATTSAVTGWRSSASAEQTSMRMAHTSARQATDAVRMGPLQSSSALGCV
jgi:methyl-accepting chemotaxis protein